jgi:hypothetical protein
MAKSERQIPLIEPEMPLFDGSRRESDGPSAAEIPDKPEFVDNRELRLVDALRSHLDWLRETYAKPVELSVATGYFNPQGFGMLADRLRNLERTRLLLGAEPLPPPAIPLRMPGEPRGEKLEARLVREELRKNEEGLARDRNLVPFAPDDDRALAELLEFLKSGKVEVRRFEKGFLHGKAFIFASDEGVISGSSNFTAAGLTSNLELNLGRYDPTPVKKVRDWFDRLWSEAVHYDLAALYAARFEAYDPYLIFLRVLWERYGSELEDEAADSGRIQLTTFQTDGIIRARRICDRYNGVLIADGVGLGKTFVAGKLLHDAIEDRRQRALLIAPAALRDGTWKRFADVHSLYMECVSYEELADDIQLGGTRGHLKQKANDYALVVVDEAQAFRNPLTRRAQALRKLLEGHPSKTLVLLSATPVNNSLWDLYYLLSYFLKQDAALSELGLRSLREKFADAVKQDPDDLSPDALFDVLDATTVRRTRHFVRRYYPNDRVRDSRGREIPVQFPTPHVQAINYSLDDELPGFFEDFKLALAPEEGEPLLTLARYAPSQYRRGAASEPGEAALIGLLRSALLKRFESSGHAFAATAEKMARAHEAFLEGLDQGVILTAEAIEEWEQTDNDEALDDLIRTSGSLSTKGYEVEKLRADVRRDRDLLHDFARRAATVRAENDPKLACLIEALVEIEKQARREGLDEQDVRNKRKVVIFSYFGDTVEWITEHLKNTLETDRRLAPYRGRMVSVVGDESRDGITRERAVFGFAPESSEAPPGADEDRYDILITTDVLAEGVNLQQARNIINYDLPWNPMRLVQRHGRIDRIGSPHRDVYVRCFFPDKRLNDLLDLESRIRRKLKQAAASIGVEHEVIPGAATGEQVFAETREEIEKLKNEDASIFENAGEDPSAHSGEEYRQELRKGLERYGEKTITGLPWGAGSGFIHGRASGHFFCAKVGNRVFLRFVPAEGDSILRDTLGCLKLIACKEDTPRHVPDNAREAAYAAWERARRDIFEEWKFATDPANLQPRIRAGIKAAADHIRKYPPPEFTQEEIDRLIECIEAPWGARIERQIRECLDGGKGVEASVAIAARVRELGLEPFKAPTPLPPIEEEEVRLVCWLVVKNRPTQAS